MHVVNRITPLALALVCSVGLAQETTATLVGNVRTKKNDAVAGATIRITSPALLGERVIKGDAKGGYRIPLLPTGTYTATFSAPGYLTNKSTFTLLAGQVIRQDSVMKAESELQVANAVVEVVASVVPAQVDKTQTVTQSAMSVETMQMLGQSSIHTAVLYSPGVTKGTGWNDGSPDFSSIRGGAGSSTTTVLNGGNTRSQVKNLSEFPPTIMDMVDSMAVIQSPLNAKYGNTSGGVISWATSRGSNEFQGVIRRKITRQTWDAAKSAFAYPDRLGVSGPTQAPNDVEDNSGIWQVTLKGPIIKDRLTFAYATQMYPEVNSVGTPAKSVNDKAEDQIFNRQSTFYKDLATGAVLRQSHLSPWDGQLQPSFRRQTWNQATLFFQINDNHSLEFGQTEASSSNNRFEPGQDKTSNSWGDVPVSDFNTTRRLWNLGYKGILGTGVLEIRTGAKIEEYKKGFSATPGVSSYVFSNQIKENGQARLANNYLEAYHGSVGSNTMWSNGHGSADFDALKTYHSNANYQFFLEAKGNHVFDIGAELMKTEFNDKNVTPIWVSTYGRLGKGLSDPNAGKFVVIPHNATVGDLTGGTEYRFNTGSTVHTAGATSLLRNLTGPFGGPTLLTTMYHNYGAESGDFYSENSAFYLNDHWTFNDHHSLMMGARLDRYMVKDEVRSIHSFTTFSPRLEYKFDVAGDQKRVVNLSWGRFTDTLYAWLFKNMAQSYLGNRTTKLWTGQNPDGSSRPYLVDYSEMIRPENYGFINSASVAGGVSNQLNPNMRAPQSEELTLGFRRSFENGTFYRATLVHKFWRNLYTFTPGVPTVQPLPGGKETPVLPKVLGVDDQLKRTYNSLELEWNFVFTPKVQLGGNYTYSRTTTNDRTNVMQSPMSVDFIGMLWRDHNNNTLPNSEWEGEFAVAGGHVFNAWLATDLSRGKLKQSAVLRGNYTQGSPFSNNVGYQVDAPVLPGAPTSSLPPGVVAPLAGGGQFRGNDRWSLTFIYNLQIPIYKKLAWFCTVEAENVLNTIQRGGWSPSGGGLWLNWKKSDGVINRPVINNRPINDGNTAADESRFGFRRVVVETGIRF